jgi:hypothetical protein
VYKRQRQRYGIIDSNTYEPLTIDSTTPIKLDALTNTEFYLPSAITPPLSQNILENGVLVRRVIEAPQMISGDRAIYEFLTNIQEARFHAMARVEMLGWNNVDSTKLWTADLAGLDIDRFKGLGPNDKPIFPYEHHVWHSGEFHMTIMEQKKYWRAVIEQISLGATKTALP